MHTILFRQNALGFFFSFFRLSDHLSVFRKACNEQKKVLLPIHFCENLGV